MSITEVLVNIDCTGCENRIKKALYKLKGVTEVETDMMMQKVTVTGWVDQKKVLKTVRKTGKHAVFCPPYTGNNYVENRGSFYSNSDRRKSNYDVQHIATPARHILFNLKPRSYNYRKHGYDDSVIMHAHAHAHAHAHQHHHANYYNYLAPSSHIISENTSAFFSDDNPHSCSIM